MIPLDRLRSHIDELCREQGVTISYHSGYRARAWRKTKKVRISTIKSDITYAVALHEIGHILGRYPKHRIDREVAAWEWAKANALVWTPAMQRTASRLLGGYVKWTRRHQTAIVPGPGHPVFNWVEA